MNKSNKRTFESVMKEVSRPYVKEKYLKGLLPKKTIQELVDSGGPLDVKKFDDINKPAHYNQGKIEVSDFIIDQKLDFLEGNIVKYVSRYKHKEGLKDLKKARWYLNKLIEEVEKA